jgi:hypothetical protein
VHSDRPVPEHVRQQIETMFHSDSMEWMLDCLIERAQEEWRTSPPDDPAARERLYWKVQAVEGLKSEVKRICTADAVEAHNRALRRQRNWSSI